MTLGNAIDSRGINVGLEEGDLLGDVIVVAEVIKNSGQPYLVVVRDDGMNWLKEDGMLGRALDKVRYESAVQ